MKQLIIPAVIAILAGVGGGSGYAYMRASKQFVVDSTHRADSLKTHPPKDSTQHGGAAAAHEGAPHDSAATAAATPTTIPEPLTPADSIRALEAARTSLREETKGLTDAKPVAGAAPQHAPAPAPAPTSKAAEAPTTRAVAPTGGKTAKTTTAAAANTSAANTQAVASALTEAKRDAMQTALPEARLAKIFGAMKAKEAAKVLDQMNDADVRAILTMMSDKQAGAILSSLPPARAAAVSKNGSRIPAVTPGTTP